MDSLKCPECDGVLVLKDSRFGKFYGCMNWPKCDVTHGAHDDGTPLGIPANKATREARMRAHEEFDTLWKGHRMTRGRAYEWMRQVMSLSEDEAHIGKLDQSQCEELIGHVKSRSSR